MARTNDSLHDLARSARARRDEALQARAGGVQARAAAAQELKALEQRYGPDHQLTRNAANRYRRVLDQLMVARRDARKARNDLQDVLKEHLPPTPEADVASLSGADPLVLLPVRIETRFERRPFQRDGRGFAGVLKVRIYPDAVAANLHEPRLSDSERDAGFDYWRTAWAAASEADAWTALIAEVPGPRAAWVVRQTTPTNFPADFPAEANANGPAPEFPPVELRPPAWQEHPSTNVLPDRWIVLAFRDSAEIGRAVSEPVLEPLALSMSLSPDGSEAALQDVVDLSNGLQVDDEIEWTVRFARALAVGMAVELPLTEAEFESGIEQLLALGVKPSLSAQEGATRLGQLIDAHHYSRGFAFVPQGAPTNNVSDAPSWLPQPDPRGTRSFGIERAADLVAPDVASDGARFMRALGVPIGHAAHIEGADADEQRTAAAMAEALWPCTLGYFLEQMMHPVTDDEDLRVARSYFVDNVRARGPYPAFRVGDVPYGLLPVTVIDEWNAYDDRLGIEQKLQPLLMTAREVLAGFLSEAPRVNRSDDADRDFLETLGMEASAREAWVRRVLGIDATWNFARFSGIDPARMEPTRKLVAGAILAGLGHADWDPRVLYANFSDPPYRFSKGLVVNDPEDPLSESAPLDFNYINWLRTRSTITQVRDAAFPAGLEQPPQSLLYLMLRHATLQQFTRCALDFLLGRRLVTAAVYRERELIGIVPETREAPTLWQHMQVAVPGVTGGRPIDALPGLGGLDPSLPPVRDLDRYRAALAVLENLPTAELERLFTETMDVCSHRVDAWITAITARRLNDHRESSPGGCHLAAYGWVENLRADQPSSGTFVGREGGVRVRDDSGGYVYSPSMTHGAAAAVLLNAYLTRQGAARERYAIDLSSRRTRIALDVLSAVRNGNALGAVLGYQFERGLHEGHPGVELDEFIDDFRNDYPLARNEGRDSTEPAANIVARNVVDGLALRSAWRGEPGFDKRPWETITATDAQRAAVRVELDRLDETVDAVSDLLLADSVFQFVSGKMDAAAATLKAVGEGARPPEGEITKVPRTGTDFTQRVALILGGDPIDIQAQWNGPHGERARVEPHLDGWVGRQLGDPATVRCEVHFESGVVAPVTLDELDLDPLDVLALAQASESASEDSELDRRVRLAAGAAAAPDEPFFIHYQLDVLPAGQRTFAALLEAARALNDVLSCARALAPKDLIPPERAPDLESTDPAIAPDLRPIELQNRAVAARARFVLQQGELAAALAALKAVPEGQPAAAELDALRTELRGVASFGVLGSYPRTFTGDSAGLRADLTSQAQSVLRETALRLQRSLDAADPVGQLKALFGRGLIVVPRFRPARPDDLQAALDDPPNLGANPRATLATWEAQLARVRKTLGLWRRVQQYARAGGTPADNFAVTHLPVIVGAAWVGLPFAEPDRPRRGLISLALHGVPAPAADQPWSGLLLDEWVESIPNRDEDAGVVFHHDSPGAEAPQAVLIAVPPAPQKSWNLGLLVRILQQTLRNSKVRGVDRENVGFIYGQLIPMIYLAQNTRSDTVSTSFAGQFVQQAFFFQTPS